MTFGPSFQAASVEASGRTPRSAAVEPTARVFGVGWAKTGTTTLAACLRALGFDHQSQDLSLVRHLRSGDLSPIRRLAAAKQSFDDWPWIALFEELDEWFPGSKFVLTVRDETGWLRSYRNMGGDLRAAPEALNAARRTLYGLPFPHVSDEQLLERYREHNEAVTARFAGRPDALLVVDWSKGHGWPELCGFLGRPAPAGPFPHANRGRYGGAAGAAPE